ncbi:MAG: translocation/assembly module TamB domain-containing protein, partial [candidate division Zixibacteria bacterium]|nr:translocation/assembly module TamB domain-containing protein [candidate division Zixibacteria bacterium]
MKQQHKKYGRLIKILALSLFSLLTLAVLFIFFMTLPPGENLLKDYLQSLLKDTLRQEVTIGHLETNLFSRLQLREIKIFDDPEASSGPRLHIHRLEIEYRLPPLWHKELRVTSVLIDSVEVALHRDSLGRFNIMLLDSILAASAAPADTGSKEAGFTINLESFTMQNLSGHYIDDLLKTAVNVNSISCRGKQEETNRYHYEIALDSMDIIYDSVPVMIAQLKAGGYLDENSFSLESFWTRLEGLILKADAAMATGEPYGLRADIQLTGDPERLFRKINHFYTAPPLKAGSELTLNISLRGDLDTPELALNLYPFIIFVDNLEVQNHVFSARWYADTLWLDTLEIQAFGGLITGSGNYVMDSISSRTGLVIKNIDLASIWSWWHNCESPYQGKIDGAVALTGQGRMIENWQFTAGFKTRLLKYKGQTLPDFYSVCDFKNNHADLNIHQENFEIKSDVTIRDDSLQGSFTADIRKIQPLAEFLNIPDLDGLLLAEGTLSGSLSSPAIQADIHGHEIKYLNFPVDSLRAEISYRDSILQIKQLTVAGALDHIDSTRIFLGLDSLSGGFTYTGHLKGNPDNLNGGFDLKLFQPRYKEYGLDSGAVHLTIEPGHLFLNKTSLHRGSSHLAFDGHYDFEKSEGSLETEIFIGPFYAGDTVSTPWLSGSTTKEETAITSGGVISTRFNLADTANLVVTMQGKKIKLGSLSPLLAAPSDFDGDLDLKLNFTGRLAEPSASLEISVTDPYYDEVKLDSLSARLELANDILRLMEFKTFGEHHSLSAEAMVHLHHDTLGDYSLSEHSRFEGSLNISKLDLASLDPFWDENLKLSGLGTLDLRWDGTILYPCFDGRLAIENSTAILNKGNDTLTGIEVKGTIRDSVITIEQARATVLKNQLQLTGTAVVSEWKSLKTDMNLTIGDVGGLWGRGILSPDTLNFESGIDHLNLSLLQPFVPRLSRLSGELNSRINLSGNMTAPRINGFINVDSLLFQPDQLQAPFRNGIARLRFDRSRIEVDSLLMQFNDGSIYLNGYLVFEDTTIKDINLSLAADNIVYTVPREYQLNVRTARLNYRKPNDYFLLGGDIELGESRLLTNFKPQSILPWAQKLESPSPELPDVLQQTRMDIRLRESNQLWIDNNLDRLRLHSELGVIGSLAQPNFSGRINVEEGYLLYLDRQFKIQQGFIFFSDPLRFNPEINLKAEARVTSYQAMAATPYTITFAAEGLLDELAIRLYSEPPLDKSDIVSLLTVGATRSQLTGKDSEGKSETKNILIERAQVLSSQKVSGFVSRKVETSLNFAG